MKRKEKENSYYRVWRSKGFVLALFVVVLFMGVSVTKEVIRRVETRYEIEKLENEVQRLSSRNQETIDIIAYLNTSVYQDKEARVKLGLQEPGEKVVMYPQNNVQQDIVLPDSDKIRYIPIDDYQSNPEKWFYFFWDKINKTT